MLQSRALIRLLNGYLGLCSRTARWEVHGADKLEGLARGKDGFVMAFWHECLPIMPLAWTRFWSTLDPAIRRKPGLVLVSHSRDGAMIGGFLSGFGLTPVSGSSSRGGQAAGLELLRGVCAGSVAVIVPDGPRGPRRTVSEGGIRLAAMAGVPIVPCGAFAAPSRRLGSWDRMILPFPFARCVAVVGEPIGQCGQSLGEQSRGTAAASLAQALTECAMRAEAIATGRDAAPG